MPDHLPFCDVCQVRPASITSGCVELCSTCAVDELERHLDDVDPENRLGRDLALTGTELLAEHGIAVVEVVHLLGDGLLPACAETGGRGYRATPVLGDVTCPSCRALSVVPFAGVR